MSLGRIFAAGALAAVTPIVMPGSAKAVPIASADYTASAFDTSTRTLDTQSGFTVDGAVSASGGSDTTSTGTAYASSAGSPVALSASVAGTGTVTAGAGANLTYYFEWAGPSGPVGSLPVDISLILNTTIAGNNASSGARFTLASFGLVSDGVSFSLGVGCNVGPSSPVTCSASGSAFDGTLVFGLTPDDVYQITMSANAGAGGTPLEDSATAFADPSIFLDPSFTHPGDYTLLLSDGIGNGLPGGGGTGGGTSSVPEPASLALFGTGLLGLAMIRRQRKS